MIPQYIFKLNNGVTDVQRTVFPRWKADLSLDYAYESNQMFRRAGLSGNLTFVGADYDYIVGTPFENTFTLEIYVSYDNGSTSSLFWSGVFHWTDCTINADDKTVKVKPQTSDRYSKILAGMDKEYDLIKLNPVIQPITVTRRPMIQIYVPGDNVVSCILSEMQWEQDADSETSENKLHNDYHFDKCSDFVELNFTGTIPQYMTDTFIGTWPTQYRNQHYEGEWRTFQNAQGVYFITYFQNTYGEGTQNVLFRNGLRCYAENNPSTVLWEFRQDVTNPSDHKFLAIPDDFTMGSSRSGVADLTGTQSTTPVYARLCLAKSTYNGQNAYEIPDGDLVSNNRNYRYCIGIGTEELVVMTYNHSSDPTQWGIRPDGDYYTKPTQDLQTIAYMPIARSTWGYASIWYRHTAFTVTLEQNGRADTEIRDAFTLEAVINALLSEIDPTIQFDATQIYSRFLFGTNPLLGGSSYGRLVMTPKSNILVAEYTQPARKAPITMGQVLEMLKKVLGCYWYINDQNQLIIEHVSWFKNGGSYSGVQAVGIDITTAENTRNGKMWSFGTNEYTFEKADMPERYQYEWMDDTTEVFKGQAIDVVSTFVEQGKVEEINVSGFNPDIDYMMLNPSNVSEDGFALINCTVTNNSYVCGIYESAGQAVQNFNLSMEYVQPLFLISDMPSWNIKVNGSTATALGIQRKKMQTVSVPLGYLDPNVQQLVATGLGNGEITKMNINLSSRTAKTTLAYDTTQQ